MARPGCGLQPSPGETVDGLLSQGEDPLLREESTTTDPLTIIATMVDLAGCPAPADL